MNEPRIRDYGPIVAPDARLRRVPDGLRLEDRVMIEGARYSFDMIELAHTRLLNQLVLLGSTDVAHDRLAITSAVMDVWMIVDAVSRLRGILSFSPALSTLRGVKAFLSATQHATALRNRVQHIPGRARQQVASFREPLWGTLTWLTYFPENAVVHMCTVVPGSLSRTTGVRFEGMALSSMRTNPGHVVLAAHESRFSVDLAVRAARLAARAVERNLQQALASYPAAHLQHGPADVVLRIGARVNSNGSYTIPATPKEDS